MATMILKEHTECGCGSAMFAYKIDKDAKKITYKCIDCNDTIEKCFDEMKVDENEGIDYFCLNDDGVATWKCFTDGYCEFMLEDLWYEDRIVKFIDLGCAMCKYPEELQEDYEITEEDTEILRNILNSLSEDQFMQLSEQMEIESFEDEITFETYIDNYEEALLYEQYEGMSDFIETVKSNIFDLFEIEFDENGNIFRLDD